MHHRTATISRSGITLVEVLVAIFVMALGLMALLTLFPVGALSMAQAIQAERAAEASQNANALFRINWKQLVETNPGMPDPTNLDPALENPCPVAGYLPDRSQTNPMDPSYPVLIDAAGVNALPAGAMPPPPPGPPAPNFRDWVAGMTCAGVPRRTLTSIANTIGKPTPILNPTYLTLSQFGSLDDLNLGKDLDLANGLLPGQPLSPVQRDNRYSWSLLVRRPRTSEKRFLNVSLVIYRGRTLVPQEESAFEAWFSVDNVTTPPLPSVNGDHMVAWIVWDPAASQTQPTLRAGNFILDVNDSPPAGGQPWVPMADFYRVVNVGEAAPMALPVGTTKQYVPVELQIGDRTATLTPTIANRKSRVVVMEYMVEVIDKSSVELP
jgi:type II secretory pathway pseudopilin PulG